MVNVLAIVFVASVLVAAFTMFDRLVRLEYTSYRRDWEADGNPHGFFWVPQEVRARSLIRSSLASRRCALVWIFSTPSWVRKDETAKRLLFWLRAFVGIWNISLLLIVLFTFSHLFD